MATIHIAPGVGLTSQDSESERNYWLWRRRSERLRLVISGASSWLLHGCIILAVLWGSETLVSKRADPPRVDVVAAVGEAMMGAPGYGDDGVAPGDGQATAGQPPREASAATGTKFIPDTVPDSVTNSLPKPLDLKLPGAEIVSPIIGGNGGLIGVEDGTGGGNGGRGGGGGYGTSGLGPGLSRTEFIGVHGTGTKFVFVIDRSGSMRERLDGVKRELLASLAKLPPEAQFQVIFYNLARMTFSEGGKSQRLVFATDSNKTLLGRHLEKVIADGGTDHLPALRDALKLAPDVVFFLTDADDLKMHEVKEVTDLNRGRAAIHAIEFSRGPEPVRENLLQKLAEWNSGTYRYVNVERLGRQ
jgi:hypothetical protein